MENFSKCTNYLDAVHVLKSLPTPQTLNLETLVIKVITGNFLSLGITPPKLDAYVVSVFVSDFLQLLTSNEMQAELQSDGTYLIQKRQPTQIKVCGITINLNLA